MENTSQTPPPVGMQEEQAGGGNFERLREYLAAANKFAVGSQFYEQAPRVDRKLEFYGNLVSREYTLTGSPIEKIQELFCQLVVAAGDLSAELGEVFMCSHEPIPELADLAELARVLQRVSREGLRQVEAAKRLDRTAKLFAESGECDKGAGGNYSDGDVRQFFKDFHGVDFTTSAEGVQH